MKLYGSGTSPYVRKVAVLLRELALLDRVEVVEATGGPTAPGSLPLAQNPLGKIPTLERPDGPTLYDSRVICRYLDDLADGRLYPSGPRLWDSLTLEATGDGMLDAAVLMVYETRASAEGERSEAWVAAQWAKIARSLDALESRWMAHLAGRLDIGHIAVGCALGYLDFRHGDRDWRAGRPALAGWAARFAERPSMLATRPPAG